jgi:hypothetical protein
MQGGVEADIRAVVTVHLYNNHEPRSRILSRKFHHLKNAMASSNPASPRKTSLDEEPLLPTYEQFQTSDADAATLETPPETTATPDQIRDFIVHLLTIKRGLALDHARRIASKWTIGNGKELRNYPPSMYLDIFGREDGWVVYKEVKLCIVLHEKSDKPTSILGLCKCSCYTLHPSNQHSNRS